MGDAADLKNLGRARQRGAKPKPPKSHSKKSRVGNGTFRSIQRDDTDKNELKKLQADFLRLENAILSIAKWTRFDLQLLQNDGFQISASDSDFLLQPVSRTSQSKPGNSKQSSCNGGKFWLPLAKKSTGLAPNARFAASQNHTSIPGLLRNRRDQNSLVNNNPPHEINDNPNIAVRICAKKEKTAESSDDYENDRDSDHSDYVPSDDNLDFFAESFGAESSDEGNYPNYLPEPSESNDSDEQICKIVSVKSIKEVENHKLNPSISLIALSKATLQKYNIKLPRKKRANLPLQSRSRTTTGDDGRKTKTNNNRNRSRKFGSKKCKGPYPCKLCPGEVFTLKAAYIEHVKKNHKVKKPYKMYTCEFCGKTTRRKHAHMHHVRTHTKEKPFLCNVCGFSTGTNHSLQEHLKIHTDERPISCDECNLKFRRKNDMLKHKVNKHNYGTKKLAPCPTCKAEFRDKVKLQRHISAIHNDIRTFECNICEQKFKRSEHLKKHIERHANPLRRIRGPQKPMLKKLPPSDSERNKNQKEPTVAAVLSGKAIESTGQQQGGEMSNVLHDIQDEPSTVDMPQLKESLEELAPTQQSGHEEQIQQIDF